MNQEIIWKSFKDELPPIEVETDRRIFYKRVLFLDDNNEAFGYGFLETLKNVKTWMNDYNDSENIIEKFENYKWLDIEFLKKFNN